MKGTTIIAFSLLTLVLLSTHCFAGQEIHNGVITKVRPDNWSGGGAFIWVSGGTFVGTASCTNPQVSAPWYFIRKDNVMFRELLAAALAANATGQEVIVVGNGVCTSNYEGVRLIELLR